MKFEFLMILEHHELLALSGADVHQWLEQKLDGKVDGISEIKVTVQKCGKGYMTMQYLFEVINERVISEQTMKAWLSDPPPYFRIRTVQEFNGDAGE